MIPATKRILAVENISLLETHSPLEIFGLALIRGNLKRVSIHINGLFMHITQILDLNISFIHCKDLSPAPNELIILAIGLDDIDKIILFQGTDPLVVGGVIKVVMGLNNKILT